ncbi:MAG: hypothetical protein IJU18_01200 [Oscillospiraceae bacterium]|nr:hypothetical protein [Oscillospiraceae bacterium]
MYQNGKTGATATVAPVLSFFQTAAVQPSFYGGQQSHPKGGDAMRFTFTFHIGTRAVTISIVTRKCENRHRAG